MTTFKLLLLSVLICLMGTVGAAQAQQPALRFVPLPPCRVADTRNANGPFGGPFIAAQSARSFEIPNSACGVPSSAAAYSLNVTAVPKTYLGYLTVWPTGQQQPGVSTLNSTDGRVKANAAIVPAGTNGAISVYVTDATDVILDINGYFVDAGNPSALAFFPLTPCRLVDTRDPSGQLGGPSLVGAQERSFPIRSSNCGIPASAVAYSLNFTAVPPHGLGFLSAWPSGITRPLVSTLNAPTGQVTANAAIVPAGNPNGAISVYASSEADVIIDVNGYFAAPGSAPNPLSLYTLTPCRVLDTRDATGLFSGTLSKDATASPCGVMPSSRAVVLNATVVPAQPLSFISLWPSGQTQPWVSTLNAIDALVTSNMAIVPTSSGVIDAYATDRTHLVLDTTGYFASGTDPAPTTYVLTVARSGVGSGTVTSLDNKFDCGAVCAIAYLGGTTVTLTASPTAESYFAGWSGGGCSGTGTCTVGLTSSMSVTAPFGPAKAQGVYSGSGSDEFDYEIIVLPNDKLYALYGINSGSFFDIWGVLIGQGSSNNGSYTANVVDFFLDVIFTGSVSASYGPGATISGTLTEPDFSATISGTGLASSAYNFNQPASLSNVVGFWTGRLSDDSPATVQGFSNGTFTSENLGCLSSGTFSPDSSNKNFFNVSLTFGASPCASPGQTMSGIAIDHLLPDGVTRELFVPMSLGTSSGTVFFSTNHTSSPPPPSGTVTGDWYFAATSSLYSVFSSGYGTLQQSGTTVTGQFAMSGSPCATNVTLSGTLTGTTFTFQALEGTQYVNFSGTLNANYTSASGTYQAPSGGCTAGDHGTWTAIKQ